MKKKTFRFYVDKDCNWFQDNNPITHKGIYNFNYQNLNIDEDGDFYVMEDGFRTYVEFQDRPFLVKSVDIKRDKIVISLNDATKEDLNIKSLFFKGRIPYCTVKKEKFTAKFSRPALFQLSKAITTKNGDFYIGSHLISQSQN
jgi:hypothetical protein